MITVEFTEAEAEALDYLVMGVDEPEDEDNIRTATNKITTAIEKEESKMADELGKITGLFHKEYLDHAQSVSIGLFEGKENPDLRMVAVMVRDVGGQDIRLMLEVDEAKELGQAILTGADKAA